MREASNMGRPREFDSQEALEAITKAFWAKGFEGTSITDLMAVTGLNKGSLYAAFGDKQALYRQALAHYDEAWIGRLVESLNGDSAPIERIERLLQTAVDGAAGRKPATGCFLCNAAIEQAPADPAARRLVKASLARLESALVAVVSELAVADPEKTTKHILSVYFGLRVLAKAGNAPASLLAVKQSALEMLSER